MRLTACLALISVAASACFSPDSNADDANGTGGTTSGPESSGGDPSSAGPVESTDPTNDPTTDPTPGTASSDTGATTTVDPDTSAGPETGTGTSTGGRESCEDAGRMVWINFDGAELVEGLVDNAPFNVTRTMPAVGTWPAYADGDIAEVFAAVESHWAPYDVCVALEQPATTDYEMVVVTSTAYMGNPNTVGFGAHDCDDAEVNNIALVFLASEINLPVPTKAIAISNQLATTFGLEGVMDAPEDLMNMSIGATLNGATFTDTCYTLSVNAVCDPADDCATGEQQSNPQLLAALGPA